MKIKETVVTAMDAVRYSFAFCVRNDRLGTFLDLGLRALATIVGYLIIVYTGSLVSSLQAHLMGEKPSNFTVYDFIEGDYAWPVGVLVTLMFVEIFIYTFKWLSSSRRRSLLQAANALEVNKLVSSLDVGRIRSKEFDDLERKISELPTGSYTRIRFADEVIDIAGDVITLTVFGVSLLFTNPWIVLILTVMSLPMILAQFVETNRCWRLQMDLIPHHKKRGVLERAYNNGVAFLQALMFNQFSALGGQIRENRMHVVERWNNMRWTNLQIILSTSVLSMAGLTSVLVYAVWQTLSNGGDIGALTVVIASSRRLHGSLRDIAAQVAQQWLSAQGVVMIEKEFFGLKPLIQTSNPVVPEFVKTPTIRFENVSFSYPDKDVMVLKNLSFSIEPYSKVAIVGKSGGGKSSLIALLLREYDPTAGRITVGEINLKNIETETWSRTISALTQHFTVLDRKIGEEIASSRLDRPVDLERVGESSRFAEFEDVIKSDPHGLSSQIGTEFGGREFSGGEEQRLAIARVHYRGTPVLIFDEPDASLDPDSAEKIMNNVFSLRDVTVIIVTHHVSRTSRCDKVIVLHEGEIAEMGTHAELMEKGGRYASMFKKDSKRLNG